MKTSSYSSIALAGLKAIAVAVVVNVVLFFAFSAAGMIPKSIVIPNAGGPLTATPVAISSTIPLVIATLLFMGLVRFTRRPALIFTILAGVVALASLASPFSIPGVPLGMVVALNVMHLVAAGSITWFLTKSVAQPTLVA